MIVLQNDILKMEGSLKEATEIERAKKQQQESETYTQRLRESRNRGAGRF